MPSYNFPCIVDYSYSKHISSPQKRASNQGKWNIWRWWWLWSQSKWDWSGYNTSSRRRKAEGRKPQNEKQEGGERTERAMGVAERKTELETTFCCCRSLCPLWVTMKCYLVVICPDGVTTDLFSRKHTLKREWLPFFKAFSSTSFQWLDPSLSKAPG